MVNTKSKSIFTLALFSICFQYTLYSQNGLKVASGGTLDIPYGTSIFVMDNVNLSANSVLKNSGTIIVYKKDSLTGNFIDSSTSSYNYGIGRFTFTGTSLQTVKSLNQFGEIEIDNNVALLSDIKANQWLLKNGKVNTSGNTAIATSSSPLSVSADGTNPNFTNSWINGKLQRAIDPITVNNYQFPVGNASKVTMLEMDNLTASPLTGLTNVTASFGIKPGNDAGLNATEPGMAYAAVHNEGVWYLTPNANPTGGKYDLKLYFNGFTGLTDNTFGILRRPDLSSNASEWQVPTGSNLPAAGSAGRIVSAAYAKRNNISTFSQYGIGTTSAALPLQLLSFTAVKKDKNVLLQWATANEVNVSHFELYRGVQPASLSYLNKISAGPFANNNYSFTDVNPLDGISYYQLKMIDKNAAFKVGPTAKINFDALTQLSVYPNPVTGNMLIIDCSNAKNITVSKLIAIDGKQIICSINSQSANQLSIVIPAMLAKGTYTLQLNRTSGETINTKISIQ